MSGNLILRIRQSVRRFLEPHVFATPLQVEQGEWKFYLDYLREGMVAFDVGAHVGELTLLFSKFVGAKGQVHAFEASSASFKRLQTACVVSGRSNIVLHNVALADREGMVKLHVYDHDHLSWSSLADRPLHKYGIPIRPAGTEEVPATTVDAFCDKHAVFRIDLLKIDVEGAEYQVLLGARRMLQEKRIRCCVFEFGATTFDMGNSPDAIEEYLAGFGYALRNIVSGDPVFPGRRSAETARFSMHVAMPES
jgi:FkbM family methyltransferase